MEYGDEINMALKAVSRSMNWMDDG